MKEGIRVEKIVSPKSDEDEDEDEDDEVEVKHRTLSKEVLLGAIETNAKLGIQMNQIKGKGKDNLKGKWFTRVVRFIAGIDGNLEVDLKEVGAGLDGATAHLRVPAPYSKILYLILCQY